MSIADSPSREPLPIRRVYELRPARQGEISVTPLRGAEKLRVVMDQTYRRCFIQGLGVQASHFRQALALAGHTAMAVVNRPTEPFRLHELADRIVADFESAPRWTTWAAEH